MSTGRWQAKFLHDVDVTLLLDLRNLMHSPCITIYFLVLSVLSVLLSRRISTVSVVFTPFVSPCILDRRRNHTPPQ